MPHDPLTNPIRLGVIGLGLIWLRVHRPILETLADTFEIVALCDSDAERRAAAAREFPAALVCAQADELLVAPQVDVVLVLTPLTLNARMAAACLHAGKDVIMEKPIGRSVIEGAELIASARRQGRRLLITEQFGYRREEEVLSELLAARSIGEVILWQRVQHFDADGQQGALRYDSAPWRRAAEFPLGALFDGGIHRVAALSRVFGAPQSVFASGRRLQPDYGAYHHVAALFQYASGLVGMLSYSSCLTPLQDCYIIHGDAGVLTVEQRCVTLKRFGQPDEVIELPDESDYVRMWAGLVYALRSGNEPRYTAEMALREVAILEAVDRSISHGERVEVGDWKPDVGIRTPNI